MRKTLVHIILAALLLCSCRPDTLNAPPLHRVTIMYAAAYSTLSGDIRADIEDMCNGMLPTLSSGDVFLVYAHTRPTEKDPNINPVLFRAWRDTRGNPCRDTLKVYPHTDISSTPEVMHKVLSDVQDLYPAPHYGLMISSHGNGWIPVGYKERNDLFADVFAATREVCIENVSGSGIDVNLLPGALPMKMDYIMMDSCLMGCVEVAYELKDKCGLLLFSPTEVLSDGLVYTTMGDLITNVATPSLQTVAKQYFDHYQAQSGSYRSATITLVDCSRLELLADVCRQLTEAHRPGIAALDHEDVQAYFYNASTHFFFDLKDIYEQAGASAEELAALDAALAQTVLYHAETDKFFNLELNRVCGLSMYLPYAEKGTLNTFYKSLAWNQAIGLIQ